MNEANAFGEDVKFSPWWWEWAPRAPRSESELPVETEIAVVGSGVYGAECGARALPGG